VKRIFLVDNHPVSRLGLATLIGRQPDLEICGEFERAREAVRAIFEFKPDLTVTDISLPDMNGLELIKELQALCPDLPVLAFSVHDEMLYAERVIKAGGRGYLMKNAPLDQIQTAIHETLRGNIYLSHAVSNHLLRSLANNGNRSVHPELEVLTDRELEIFELIGKGRSTHDVAEQLCICLRTVEAHRTHIREKLRLPTASDVIRHAVLWVEAQS
jgi:DNA-binding NarL/FixJ family response regulator